MPDLDTIGVIRIHKIVWFDEDPVIKDGKRWLPHAEGMVEFEIRYHDGTHSYMQLPFAPREPFMEEGVYVLQRANLSKIAPTIRPGFVCWDMQTGARVHLYITSGLIHLMTDSNVEVASDEAWGVM